jgi:hypothetical protein
MRIPPALLASLCRFLLLRRRLIRLALFTLGLG